MSKSTPFTRYHHELQAKMVDFAGFEMPVQYKGIKQEHQAVRNRAGLFDVSHMGEFVLSGPGSLELIQSLSVNDASLLNPGRAQYTVLCRESGGIVDDLLIYMLSENRYMLVVNAANIEKDYNWIDSRKNADSTLEDVSDTTALLALQGPKSTEILQKLTDRNLAGIRFYHFETGTVAGEPDILISRTGYTGETGYELYIDHNRADAGGIWETILSAGEEFGLEPTGLGARDTLRLEMGYPLYGNDITDETTPFEAGLNWIVKPEKEDFLGRRALLEQKESGVTRILTGFVTEEPRQIPRAGYEIFNSNRSRIGIVTSGTLSITLSKGIGMGYLPLEYASPGQSVLLSIRNRQIPAVITKPPFIK
ncbi:MAG: glycine cleavage system aminomethyltransferase GcvT [Balneolaceae bacterium]